MSVADAGYSRQVVSLDGIAHARDVLYRFTRLPGMVVNIVGTDGGSALLSAAGLDATLAKRPPTLAVDVLADARYVRLAAAKLSMGLSQADALRRLLCERPVNDLAPDVIAMLRYLHELEMLLEVYGLQRRNRSVARALHVLPSHRGQLLAAASTPADNVRCMDALRYAIRPVLENLQSIFSVNLPAPVSP